MKFFLRTLYRKFRLFICYAAIVMVTMVCFITFYKSERNALTADKIEAGTKNSDKSYPFAKSYDRKDWHDWKFIEYEKLRVGPGEQGKEHILTDPEDIKLNEKVLEQNGLNGVVSDKISVNRSLPDTRPPKCANIQYFSSLPKTSVIVIFHNEYFSVLLRTVHSVYNRTPRELLLEILLVNDASTNQNLYDPLKNYIHEHFGDRVKVINLPERSGLIVARLVGARKAKGEVLVFLDAHTEVNVNWLPPLLEPIAMDPKTVTTPNTDHFSWQDFEYTPCGPETRGAFTWNFFFRWLPRLPEHKLYPERPSPIPVMLGCAFAIRKDYFFDLGGYDEGLKIWNGEHYELSIKLWLCGGKLLEVPCSRFGHVYRKYDRQHDIAGGFDYVSYNFKRIAEVWLDEYKENFYQFDPEYFAKIDPGDLTKAKLVKKNLNCKPFAYFLDQVAPDLAEQYPASDRGVFAKGVIRSEADELKCVGIVMGEATKLNLVECDSNSTHPNYYQNFALSWHRQIKLNTHFDHCLKETELEISECRFKFGSELWFYNLTSHQIVNLPSRHCLTAVLEADSVISAPCVMTDPKQKWRWGYTNVTALNNWETFGVKLPHQKKKIVVEL